MKHVAFAKIGKSIKFVTPFSAVGGDNEAPAVLKALANNNPDKTFYIIGRSDFARLTQSQYDETFPYGNVVDIWKGAPYKSFMGDGKDYDDPFYHHVGNYFDRIGVTPDVCVLMVGQVGTVTIPGKIEQVRDRSLVASVIDMTKNYTTPISVWLNSRKVPYVEIVNDPRYVMNQTRDIFHLPNSSIGQFDWEYEASHIKSYEDQDRITTVTKSRYAGMETAFCIGRKYPDISKIQKSREFAIILNEGDPSRFNMLDEWILRNIQDVEVYGRWEHPKAQKDSRFKGTVYLEDGQKIMRETKYTMIIPIREGWVTSKYLEMIHAGVIPFLHPSYDTQKHLPLPAALRPKTPEEMFNTIRKLNEIPGARLELLRVLQERILRMEYYDGSFMSEVILKECHKQIGTEYTKTDVTGFEKTKIVSLDDLF